MIQLELQVTGGSARSPLLDQGKLFRQAEPTPAGLGEALLDAPFAVFATRFGDPDVLEVRPIRMPVPGRGEVGIEQTAIAVHFADIYLRSGKAHSFKPETPFIPGSDGAGRVYSVGDGVSGLEIGDRVTYQGMGTGAYATHTSQPADVVVKIPHSVSDVQVAAGLARAITAQYLLKQLRPLQAGEQVLIHAAAGGVGQILTQWAKRLGLIVVATVGSDAKMQFVREMGADCVINYTTQDFAKETLRFTGGRGVDVVYDSVGRDTFTQSVACLAERGLAVNYGTASGQVDGFALQTLHSKSLSVCRPTMKSFISTPTMLKTICAEAFGVLADPTMKLCIESLMPLVKAADAHRLLESRTTRGAIVLLP